MRTSDDIDAAQERQAADADRAIAAASASARAQAEALGSDDCLDCGGAIPPARRKALPGASRCAPCQSMLEKRAHLGRGA